ncbi:MAG: hypothetical protein ACLTLY_08500 [Agathobacter rectalis]
MYGFYYRQIGRFDKALEMLDKSMERRNNSFSKAKQRKGTGIHWYAGVSVCQGISKRKLL